MRPSPAASTALVPWTASGELAAISAAMARASATTASASALTWLTRPMASARAAVMSLPV